ncbi:peroxidase superfamily protein [Striga asiatica]|uniref:Peroxidase superfamily protein n=1 Tax=Striga asiatica TaxID=4170 RepID=A0A5A7P3H8_STRAF|nr:peroxidase superfamily protein [Striga asiatica]
MMPRILPEAIALKTNHTLILKGDHLVKNSLPHLQGKKDTDLRVEQRWLVQTGEQRDKSAPQISTANKASSATVPLLVGSSSGTIKLSQKQVENTEKEIEGEMEVEEEENSLPIGEEMGEEEAINISSKQGETRTWKRNRKQESRPKSTQASKGSEESPSQPKRGRQSGSKSCRDIDITSEKKSEMELTLGWELILGSQEFSLSLLNLSTLLRPSCIG